MPLKKKSYTPATAPIEDETAQDLIEQSIEEEQEEKEVVEPSVSNEQKIIQVPVYLSQDQINNMVIENNLMLKELLNLAVEANQ